MKTLRTVLASFLAMVLISGIARADGIFVAPKFIWDKHKDINEPTQKAIIVYDAGQEDLILQVKYEGPLDQFGWLIPVPNLPTVENGSMKCFYELSKYTQQQELMTAAHGYMAGLSKADDQDQPAEVQVVEIKTVGAYEIAVLSSKDSGALEKWLDDNHFYFPPNKSEVIDAYVQKHWYFVAVKINLGSWFSSLLSTSSELASGELNPLQISFASDDCVFPLKISSVNGKPSEVQVYVLSPEPLLERGMLDKQLPLIYSNDVATAKQVERKMKEFAAKREAMMQRYGGADLLRNNTDEAAAAEKIGEEPKISEDELLPYLKATGKDLPDCTASIPRLAGKSWWVTKQTWTFQPEDMRDLDFKPALPVFVELLDSKYGYFAADNLSLFGADVIPTLLTAMQSTNPTVRSNATGILNGYHNGILQSPALVQPALTWLQDPDPDVKAAAINVLGNSSNWKPEYAQALLPLIRDDDAKVRQFDSFLLGQHSQDIQKFNPELHEMLKDTNMDVRVAALSVIQRANLPIDHSELKPFFGIPDRRAIGISTAYFRVGFGHYNLSDQEIIPLLQNTDPLGPLLGLRILYQNADKDSVELALPLLKNPQEFVRQRAAATLRALTGQHFTADQADEWQQWWEANKADFVVQLHPEELRPQRPQINRTQPPLFN